MRFLWVLLGTLLVIVIHSAWRVLMLLTWRPYKITKHFRDQGVNGPAYAFWSGSLKEVRAMRAAARNIVLDTYSHDIVVKVLPDYHKWTGQYGKLFIYWFGPRPRICIRDPDMIKQILSNKFGFFPKITPAPNVMALLGKGLVLVEGSDWARHRRVVSPAFSMDKLKILTEKMAECALAMLERWQKVEPNQEIEINHQFLELTADVISHAAFGSRYAEGKQVFLAQRELQFLATATSLDINVPGFQYLPTMRNLKKMWLENKVKSTLTNIINSRKNSSGSEYGNDLLGIMLEACQQNQKNGPMLTMDEIVDECKTFFFAGHETTSHLLTWTVYLLSIYPEWQERLREEVVRECGGNIHDADTLNRLKLVTIVLLETLRLYCPLVMLPRKAEKDMTLGNLKIPGGTSLMIPIVQLHRDKDIWGADAMEFKPQRFENGILKAGKHPNALLAFSIGPRACVGQNFAMLEAKLVLAMILQRFKFTLSPSYKHAPTDIITMQPQYGLPVLLTPLNT